MLAVKKPWPDPMYFFALPTAVQARRVAWQKLKALVPPNWLDGDPRESDMIIKTKFGSSLYVVGMDKPQRIEGDQWDGGVVDESSDQKPGHFDRSLRPALTHRTGWCWRIGVPKRWGVGAAEFKSTFFKWQDAGPDFAAYSWPSSDILLPSEIEAAMLTMDQKDFDEQFGANWLDVGGAIFYAFSETESVSDEVKYRPERPIIVGSDFNVNPMAWVLMQHVDNKFYVFDEVWIRNTNTQATLDVLYKRYGERHDAGFLFIGDATARSRNTRATLSDYAQIEMDKRFKLSRVLYPRSNPAVQERFAACNALLQNAAGLRRLFIHPRCKNLINDLSSRAYVEGSRAPDDHDDIGHITDALGYPLHYLCPVLVKSEGSPSVYSA
jgi:hypothetical protein